MPGYKLIVKNAKVFLKTVTNAVLNISGIKDLLTGDGSVDSNNKINWTLPKDYNINDLKSFYNAKKTTRRERRKTRRSGT